ncbi:unnamed protein product [Notodromas monacha]|uniref:Uncharacterized protein n=1 Tax=Notodromas monacha TaxID=399045 RepID=A0A7R9GEZ6_9CRUS|nr:unnamed protein product [Notodromas monacha]CAG0920276.1 unnamed protein product [Notodromas monacha]
MATADDADGRHHYHHYELSCTPTITTTTTSTEWNCSSRMMRNKKAARRVRGIMHHAEVDVVVVVVVVLLSALSFLCCLASGEPCPWAPSPATAALDAACLCALNAEDEVSVQCSGSGSGSSTTTTTGALQLLALVSALKSAKLAKGVDLLYLNNSSVSVLEDDSFRGLRIRNIQLSNCGLVGVASGAFDGLEDSLKNLNLQGNLLERAPVDALRRLRRLSLLDLSRNRISVLPDDAFVAQSRLQTLKLADNLDVTLADHSLRGLEETLKNLNLKGAGLRGVPKALQNLSALAFLDLAQNEIRQVEPGVLQGLDSLTALNLERNLLRTLAPAGFQGVADTLSSLSLLNNLIDEYPGDALRSLTELRHAVLDVGGCMLYDDDEDEEERAFPAVLNRSSVLEPVPVGNEMTCRSNRDE